MTESILLSTIKIVEDIILPFAIRYDNIRLCTDIELEYILVAISILYNSIYSSCKTDKSNTVLIMTAEYISQLQVDIITCTSSSLYLPLSGRVIHTIRNLQNN